MQDTGYVPPMSIDDFAALAAFAGPMYQESKVIESFTSSNPMPGTFVENGSMSIREGLEQAKRLAQASVDRPVYVPPAVIDPVDMATLGGVAAIAPTPFIPPPVQPTATTNNQLEFSFDSNIQSVTNDLLREISKKLSKVISLLEKGGASEKLPKPNAPRKLVN